MMRETLVRGGGGGGYDRYWRPEPQLLMIAATASKATACTILARFMGNAFILRLQYIHQVHLNFVNMIRFLLILTAFAATQKAHSQSAEDSVKTAVNALFTAMSKADANLLRATFAPSAVLQTINVAGDGVVTVGDQTVEEFATVLTQVQPGMLDERIQFEKIYIDGPLATVWTPYKFYFSGKFSHCGVNSFQLVRIKNEWKIQYIIDTRRKAGCGD